MRRYDEPVHVRTSTGGADAPPAQFLWRGRLYVVRAVLSSWVETGAWWLGPAAQLVYGTAEEPRATATGTAVAESRDESVVWRVEASAGRLAGTAGVYDLRERPPGEWSLVQALD